eukprot:4251429-Prymnesium_polylepis.1
MTPRLEHLKKVRPSVPIGSPFGTVGSRFAAERGQWWSCRCPSPKEILFRPYDGLKESVRVGNHV